MVGANRSARHDVPWAHALIRTRYKSTKMLRVRNLYAERRSAKRAQFGHRKVKSRCVIIFMGLVFFCVRGVSLTAAKSGEDVESGAVVVLHVA